LGHYLVRLGVRSGSLSDVLHRVLDQMGEKAKAAYIGPESGGERELYVELECEGPEVGELIAHLKSLEEVTSIRAESVPIDTTFFLNPYATGERERS
jgi:hypothetical protein